MKRKKHFWRRRRQSTQGFSLSAGLRIALFAGLIAALLAGTKVANHLVSKIDNRYYLDWGFPSNYYSGNVQHLEKTFNERVGGRELLLRGHYILFRRLFGEVEHTSYECGKGDWIFSNQAEMNVDHEFLTAYTKHLAAIRDYCKARGVPFLYVLNPSKSSILQDKWHAGVQLKGYHLKYLQASLKENGIPFVDNAENFLHDPERELLFSHEYDPNHWSSYGAFVGNNHVLARMKEMGLPVETNRIEDFDRVDELMTELPSSVFPIHEHVFTLKEKKPSFDSDNWSLVKDLPLHTEHPGFFDFVSEKKNGMNMLFFQGSYYFGQGAPFLARAVEHYHGVHNYENLIDFERYYNLFQPNFVLVTAAEYATTRSYFDLDRLREKKLNPPLDEKTARPATGERRLRSYKKGKYADSLILDFGQEKVRCAWLKTGGKIYDWTREDDGSYTLVLQQAQLTNFAQDAEVYYIAEDGLCRKQPLRGVAPAGEAK